VIDCDVAAGSQAALNVGRFRAECLQKESVVVARRAQLDRNWKLIGVPIGSLFGRRYGQHSQVSKDQSHKNPNASMDPAFSAGKMHLKTSLDPKIIHPACRVNSRA